MDVIGYLLRALEMDVPIPQRLPPGAYLAIGVGIESHVPGVPIAVQLGRPLSREQTQRYARLRVLRMGVPDLMTKLAMFCLEARSAGSLVNLFASGQQNTIEALESAGVVEGPDCAKFDRLVWPDKLRTLREHCGVEMTEDLAKLEACVLSINRARNCLEHRGGVVAAQDENEADPSGLRVNWVMARFTTPDADGIGEHNVQAMEYIDGDMRVNLRAWHDRFFRRGEPLVFSADDYVGFCWTISKYAEVVIAKLVERARAVVPHGFAGVEVPLVTGGNDSNS